MVHRLNNSTFSRACKRSTLAFLALLLLALAPLALSHVDPAHQHLDDSINHCELCLNQGALASVTEAEIFIAPLLGVAPPLASTQHYAERTPLQSPIRGPPSLFN